MQTTAATSPTSDSPTRPSPSLRDWATKQSGIRSQMSVAALVLVSVVVALTAAFVIGLFIWGAVKDGEKDKAIQARLGIRRRTRLGR